MDERLTDILNKPSIEAYTFLRSMTTGSAQNPYTAPHMDIDLSDSANMDASYLAVKKVQREYFKDSDPLKQYFADSFSRIDEAYLQNNVLEYTHAMKTLLDVINMK